MPQLDGKIECACLPLLEMSIRSLLCAQVPGQDAKALLLRYARKSQVEHEVFYNCRK